MQYLNKAMTDTDVRSFVSWLASKPKNRMYAYLDNGDCLVAQFLKECGFEMVSVASDSFRHRTAEGVLPKELNEVALGEEWKPSVRTFGKALARAKRIFADRL